MITLHLLGSWIKVALIAALALFIEYQTITGFWWFTLTATLTGLVFLLITSALWGEWRRQMNGTGSYRYSIVRNADRN